jgi:hypothetical protein
MHFLAAPLLFGLVLAAAPILIHLLNRRRFKIVDWAPMKYLKLTIRNNRRRMRIEQLILLILRTCLMILLAFALARPVLSQTGMAGWLSRRARVSRVIVINDTLSMGYKENGRTALDRAKQAAAEILHATGSQDAITVLTTSPASEPIVSEAAIQDPTKLISQIDALQPTDAACNWSDTFHAIDAALAAATFPQKEIVLVTDLRRSAWSGHVTELANQWASQGLSAKIIDVSSPSVTNSSVQKFSQDDPIVLPGSPAKLTATIRNDTPQPITNSQATLSIDGDPRPIILPDLPPATATEVPLSITLDKPGQHALQLTLPDDPLPGDNARFLSLDARDHLDINLVDGRIGSGSFESAGDFLELALTVGANPWHVQHYGDGDPQAIHPKRAEITAIVDAAALSPEAITQYESLVRQGMGLFIFAGEQTDPDLYNERFYKNGRGLLPAKLQSIIDGPVRGLVVDRFADSPLASLAKLLPASLAKIEAKRLMVVESPRPNDESVRVLARWNDDAAHPAVIEKRFGKGRVLLWTISADREWSDWPIDPTYVLAIRSAAQAAAWPDNTEDNLIAGHTINYAPPEDRPRSDPRITTPTESTAQPIAVENGRFQWAQTAHAGIYNLTWQEAAGKQQHQLAVSFNNIASDLIPITESQLQIYLGNLTPTVISYHPGLLMASTPGREIWRMLATTLLGLLIVETLLAFYVGRER